MPLDPAFDRIRIIGASMASACLPPDHPLRHPYTDQHTAWRRITGRDKSDPGRPAEMGQALERTVLRWASQDLGRPVEVGSGYPRLHAALPWLCSTPDGFAYHVDTNAPCDPPTHGVEVKTVTSFGVGKGWDAASFPAYHAVQCRIGMAVYDLPAWFLVGFKVWSPDELVYHEIKRDIGLESELLDLLKDFHARYVAADTPPPL